MKKKRILSIFIASILAFSPLFFPFIKVNANDEYTIILKSGEGNGEDITITGQPGTDPFYSYNNKIYYRTSVPPENFSSPANNQKAFAYWEYGGEHIYPGNDIQINADSDNILTATWDDSSYELQTPESVSVSGYGYTDVDCKLTKLHLGAFIDKNKNISRADGITFEYYRGTLENNDGKTIPYTVYSRLVPKNIPSGDSAISPKFSYNNGQPWYEEDASATEEQETIEKDFQMTIYIDPKDYNSANPGTYTGNLKYTGIYTYPVVEILRGRNLETDYRTEQYEGISATIPLTLTIAPEKSNSESDKKDATPSIFPKTDDRTNFLLLVVSTTIGILGIITAIYHNKKACKAKPSK